MKFRTEINLKPEENQINFSSKIALFGSCFSTNIADRLKNNGFQVFLNSHGILFHPFAILESVKDCIDQRRYFESDLHYSNELWFSYNHHSAFSGMEKKKVLQNINDTILEGHNFLKEASHLIITLGTAWVYLLKSTQTLVANCHKIPQSEFKKELISVEQIIDGLEEIVKNFRSINKKATIIFTISPVRHLKDGMVENALSKANLLVALHNFLRKEDAYYFPAYEIVMDDLRDYRFFEKDLVHPNELAVDYIWEKFKLVWIERKIESEMKEIASVFQSLSHRPFNENTASHQKFLEKLSDKIKELKTKYPHIKLKKEA